MRAHLLPLPLPKRTLADYEGVESEERLQRIRAAAEPLKGVRVLHLVAAGSRLAPPAAAAALERELGLDVELRLLAGDRQLLQLVRELEDGARGGETAISDQAWASCLEAAAGLASGFDVAIAHGPAPIAAVQGAGAAVLSLPFDASRAEAASWERVKPLAGHIAEAGDVVDPLAPGCIELPIGLDGALARSLGVDTSRPCVCQFDAFDGWQDPHAVLDAFTLAKGELPGLQLVMAGGPASGPEAWQLLREVSDYARERPDVLALSGLGSVELGALRRLARVALESPLGPGPGASRLETLWAGTPVLETGPEAAGRLLELVRDPGLAIELGAAGHELVRERFLVTRLVEDELGMVAGARPATVQSP